MKNQFDIIVVTAANEAQAAGYRAQLEWRRANGLLPAETEAIVIPDPGGRRVGSFAATLNVLAELAEKRRDPVAGRRILVCHSGGDSRRTPAYAAIGKAFAPLPCTSSDGRSLALFDAILRRASELPVREGGQLLVLSGDVLITLDNSRLDFSRPGLTGVAWMDTMEQGGRHGVYVPGEGEGNVCRSVADFLQKPSAGEASCAGAVDSDGLVAVDTGILSFDASLCRRMLSFARKEARWLKTAPVLDVYEHFTGALVGKGLEKLIRAFGDVPFSVNLLKSCEFFHMGSSRELLECWTAPSPTAKSLGFRDRTCAAAKKTKAFVFNSILDVSVSGGKASAVEGCRRENGEGMSLEGFNIVTGIPAECTERICLPEETGIVCLPVGKKDWTAIAYRLDDNFKTDGKWDAKLWKTCPDVNEAVRHALKILSAKKAPSGAAARGLKSPGEINPKVNHSRILAERTDIFRETVRREVVETVTRNCPLPVKPPKAAILQDQVVWAVSPVRIDFAGGWSDTPPICLDAGGTVLNAAVTLNDQYPIQVMAKLSHEPRIRLASIDLGESRVFTSSDEIQDHSNPHEWCALPKAALVLSGIVPSRPGASLQAWLKRFGGGLDLTTFSALPKGSGMGTSSILGAAVLACLDRVQGIPFDPWRVIRLASALEQRMSTGGGWQDQIGGLLPGIKLIETVPGPDQTPSVTTVPFSGMDGKFPKERCLLYFTGQKRMARNILRNVTGRWMSGEREMREIVPCLKEGARRAKAALDSGDVSAFAATVRDYWEWKKKIDPGSTNAGVEAILALAKDDAEACLLPGAGGGGFVFIVAKSVAASKRIRKRLESAPPNPASRFFDFAIDGGGLKVTVL